MPPTFRLGIIHIGSPSVARSELELVCIQRKLFMAYSDRIYVGTRLGLGPEWVTVTFTLQLMWEQVLYFGIVSVPFPVLVPFLHKFCLNKPSITKIVLSHWRIQGGRQGRAPPPGGPNSFIFMQFSAKN